MNESINIINSVELIPLEDTEINPFLTRVRIKVFHLGENRNHSFIDKPTALNMAKTLRGNPIVARYREEKQDFTDHGEEIIINDKGFEKKILTRPYGFVDLNAKVWFEDYNDTDEMGQIVPHTYLVTEGIVWTGCYEELNHTIMDGGRPQSMELDEKTLQGEWTNKINPNYEIFIINDAVITKLCALGEDTEPCFLGASILPEFALEEENFVKDLVDFKTKFNLALNNKGGNSMDENQKIEVSVEEKDPVIDTPVVEENNENFSADQDKTELETSVEIQNNTEEFAKNEDEEKKDEKSDDSKEDSESKSDDETDKEEEDDKEKKTKNTLETDYAALQSEFSALQNKFALLEKQNEELINFKNQVEDAKKDELIASFYMLSDEDKKDVIENKSKYTLDDIESKLSVICVRKKVNFNLENENEQKESPITTFKLDSADANDALPAWIKAVEAHKTVN